MWRECGHRLGRSRLVVPPAPSGARKWRRQTDYRAACTVVPQSPAASVCDRGQQYCGPQCRAQARSEQLRRAGQRYQQSQIGRLQHAVRQRANAARRRQPLRPTDANPYGSRTTVLSEGRSCVFRDPSVLPRRRGVERAAVMRLSHQHLSQPLHLSIRQVRPKQRRELPDISTPLSMRTEQIGHPA